MRKILWVFLPIILLSVGTNNGYACTCGASLMMNKLKLMEGKFDVTEKPNDNAWVDEYPGAIFTGQVLKIKKVDVKESDGDYSRYYQMTFKVDRYWKGDDSPEVVVFTGVGGGSCGFPFRKSQSYIVFAQMIQNRLQTNICTYTSESRYAENIIKGLSMGEGRNPKMKSAK